MISSVDVVSIYNLPASVTNLFRKPTCDYHRIFSEGIKGDSIITEVLKYNSEYCVAKWYIPWWLIWLAFIIGCIIGTVFGAVFRSTWCLLFSRRAAQPAGTVRGASGALVLAPRRTLRLRVGQ